MTKQRRSWLLVLVLIVGLVWVGLNRVTPETAAFTGALPPAPAIGHPAPQLNLAVLDDDSFDLSERRGQPIVVNFWATWCPPCLEELPELQAASIRLAGEVAIVGVNQGEGSEPIAAFARQHGITFPLLIDGDAVASRDYAVRSLPTTFFIDRSGIMRRVQVGALTEATLAQALESIYP